MDIDDLNHFRVDCNRREEQLRFLHSQMPSRWDQQRDGLAVTSIGGTVLSIIDGSYDRRRDVHDRRTQAVIRSYIREIETYCPTKKPKAAGCVTVREEYNSGFGQGQRCYDGRSQAPAINRWEAEVDR
jgi:hypothetical protein